MTIEEPAIILAPESARVKTIVALLPTIVAAMPLKPKIPS
jgi:hypothetical protein